MTCAQFPLVERLGDELAGGYGSCGKNGSHYAGVIHPAKWRHTKAKVDTGKTLPARDQSELGTKMTNGPKGQRRLKRNRLGPGQAICKIRNLPWQTGHPPVSLPLAVLGVFPPWGSCRIHLAPATFDYFYDQMAFYCRWLLPIPVHPPPHT